MATRPLTVSRQVPTIRIVQLNAQNSKTVAIDISQQTAKNIDIAIIQEPYFTKSNYVPSTLCRPGERIVKPTTADSKVAIKIYNPQYGVMQVECGNSPHVMAVNICHDSLNFYIINAYFQYASDRDDILGTLEEVFLKIGSTRNVLICADLNAKSPLWNSRTRDSNGRNIEEFLFRHNLRVLNTPWHPPTFVSPVGLTSFIDATFVTQNFEKFIKNWKVVEDFSTSDHNAIKFDIKNYEPPAAPVYAGPPRFNLRKADWELFSREIKSNFDNDTNKFIHSAPPEDAVKIFSNKINRTCIASIKTHFNGSKKIPWWSEELTLLRRRVTQARKSARLTRRQFGECETTNRKIREYKDLRNRYTDLVRSSKRKCWEDFVATEGNNNPWGLVYKIIAKKFRPGTIFHGVDGVTMWEDLASKMMEKMVPTHTATPTTTVIEYQNYNLENEISLEEIDIAVKKMGKRKAPGLDSVPSEVLKRAWEVDRDILHGLFNNCFVNEIFPSQWKHAEIKILLKNPTKDPARIDSYRPIALLPTIGKIFERIILYRIQSIYNEAGLAHVNQFGFRKGTSTEDALYRTITLMKNTCKKYALCIFFDIRGAFDNLTWHSVYERLEKANISSKLLNIIKSYFENRKMTIKFGDKSADAIMQKGCPQGSIIGPMAWNWVMDKLLHNLAPLETSDEIFATAYADDLALVIRANARDEIQDKAHKAINIIEEWCAGCDLQLAGNKTVAILHTTGRNKNLVQPGRISIYIDQPDGKKKIPIQRDAKYLGVIIDHELKFHSHFESLNTKVETLRYAIQSVAHERWGIDVSTLRFYLNNLFLPIVTYGSIALSLSRNLNSAISRKKLDKIQRAILLCSIKACKTVSTVALRALVGAAPLYLEVLKTAAKFHIRKNIDFRVDGFQYQFIARESLENYNKIIKLENEKLDREISLATEADWNASDSGKDTKRFIKLINYKKQPKWFRPNMWTNFLITGYGSINESLNRRGCWDAPTPFCHNCANQVENVDHILFVCPIYSTIRYPELLQESFQIDVSKLIENETLFKKFQIFAKNAFQIRRASINEQQSTL